MFHNDLKNLDYKGLLRKISDRGIASCGQPFNPLPDRKYQVSNTSILHRTIIYGLGHRLPFWRLQRNPLEVFPSEPGHRSAFSGILFIQTRRGGNAFQKQVQHLFSIRLPGKCELHIRSRARGDVIFSDELKPCQMLTAAG